MYPYGMFNTELRSLKLLCDGNCTNPWETAVYSQHTLGVCTLATANAPDAQSDGSSKLTIRKGLHMEGQ